GRRSNTRTAPRSKTRDRNFNTTFSISRTIVWCLTRSSCLRRSRSFCLAAAHNRLAAPDDFRVSGLEVEMTKNNMPLALAVAALLMITTAGFAQDQKDPQKQ